MLYCLLTLFDLLDKRQIDFNFTFEYLLVDFLEKNKEKFFWCFELGKVVFINRNFLIFLKYSLMKNFFCKFNRDLLK